MTTDAHRLARDGLLADMYRFRSFIRRRVADQHAADDILQDALLRATRHLEQLQDTERIDAWFYRIIRHTINDRAGTRTAQPLETDPVAAAADQADVCRCLVPLIDRLPPDQAQAIRAVDLADEDPAETARAAGVETNTIHARRSRARASLRELLAQACRACAAQGCRDCDCTPPSTPALGTTDQ